MQPYHAQRIAVHVGDSLTLPGDLIEYCSALATSGPAYTAMHDGVPVCCMGVIEIHPNVAQGWGLIPRDLPLRVMASIRTAARSFVEACEFRRIQIAVAVNFPGAYHFAIGLGFAQESVMRGWMPDGTDAYQFVRLRHG